MSATLSRTTQRNFLSFAQNLPERARIVTEAQSAHAKLRDAANSSRGLPHC